MSEVQTDSKVYADERTEIIRRRKKRRLWKVTVVIAVLISAAGGTVTWLLTSRESSPVPKNISENISFPVYYPEKSKLPSGYSLVAKSFTIKDDAVLYQIEHSGQQNIVVTTQMKISNEDLGAFYAATLPLSSTYATRIGTATIGAVNDRSVASIPTDTNAWLLVSAPGNINQDEFKQVLNSFLKP